MPYNVGMMSDITIIRKLVHSINLKIEQLDEEFIIQRKIADEVSYMVQSLGNYRRS